jgi:glycosyltransferase involved in cell wall biosynthesis
VVAPALTYLTMDSVTGGVGASQVLPYVSRMADRGLEVELHSFEDGSVAAPPAIGAGVTWCPHPFGVQGQVGGLGRVARGAAAVRRADVVHARSDLAAASVLLGRPRAWVWDVRSFWVDQRIALGMIRRGSAVERAFRAVERQAASGASAITTLTQAAIEELARRHGPGVAEKARVVTTCVDLDRFPLTPFPDRPLSLLLSGSYNALYDLPTMLRFTAAVRRCRPATLTLLRPSATPWDEAVLGDGGQVGSSSFADMPGHVAAHHAGLSVCGTGDRRAILAAMPTKIGELLACGRPVVVNAGLGDCDSLLAEGGAGVVLAGNADDDLDRGASELLDLVDDPDTPARCRRLAERRFSLDGGVETLLAVYREIGR